MKECGCNVEEYGIYSENCGCNVYVMWRNMEHCGGTWM